MNHFIHLSVDASLSFPQLLTCPSVVLSESQRSQNQDEEQ